MTGGAEEKRREDRPFKGTLDVRYCGLRYGDFEDVEYQLFVKADKEGTVCNLRHLYGGMYAHYYVDDSFALDMVEVTALSYRETSMQSTFAYNAICKYQQTADQQPADPSRDSMFHLSAVVPTLGGPCELATVGMNAQFDLYVLMPSTPVLERQLQFFVTVRLRRTPQPR